MNQIEAKKQMIEYLSYVIGLTSFMILGKLIGNNGITYMAVIIECISLFVLLCSGPGADVMGKLIRARRKKNQYREAALLHKAYFLIQLVAAIVLSVIYFFLTDVFANTVFHMPYLAVAMKLLTPIILLKTLQCVMSGYFQGMGAHMPTVIAAVFRQLLFLLFGLLLTGKLVNYGEKVSALLNNNDYAGMYGAVGVCLAILISEIFVSLFLLIVYVGSDRKREMQKANDGLQRIESFSERLRLVIMVSFSETMKAVLKKLPFLLILLVVLRGGSDISELAHEFGVFYGYFICVCAILVFVISAKISRVLSRLALAVNKKDKRGIREVIYAGMRDCFSAGLFISVCMAVLAPQIGIVLCKEHSEVLAGYYTSGAACLVVLVTGIFIWRALYTLGNRSVSYLLLAVFNMVFIACCVILRTREMEVLSVVCMAVIIACTVELVVSYVLIVRKYALQPDLIRGMMIPIVGGGLAGLGVMLLRNLLAPHVSSLMCLILCVITGGIIYIVVLAAYKRMNE